MSEERTTKIVTATMPTRSKIFYSQQCLLCENTRRLPEGMTYSHTPGICDECREAMAFLKDFMKSCDEAQKMLDEMKDPTKNIYHL